MQLFPVISAYLLGIKARIKKKDVYKRQENGGALVPLKGNGIDVSNAISTIQLKDGNIEATVDLINKEYAALHIIEAYERQGAQKYQEAMREKFTEWEFSDYKFQTERNTVSQSFMLKKPYESTDIIYIQPFLYGMPSEPLFKRDTRQAAIDFPYGIQPVSYTHLDVYKRQQKGHIKQTILFHRF